MKYGRPISKIKKDARVWFQVTGVLALVGYHLLNPQPSKAQSTELSSSIPTGIFSGMAMGAFFSECRINQVDFEAIPTPQEETNIPTKQYTLRWIETGTSYGPYSGPCTVNWSAILNYFGTDESGAFFYNIQFDWISSNSMSQAIFFQNKLSVRADVIDPVGGFEVPLEADLLFKKELAEQEDESTTPFNFITYYRSMKQPGSSGSTVTGRLLLQP